MKSTVRLILLSAAAALACSPAALAQRQLGKKKGPTSKIYLAETQGESQIVTGEKIYEGKQATAFDAPGTTIETKAGSHNAFVYSNGTGMYVDENTRVEVNRFVQEPFQPDRNSTEFEPSISQSEVFVARGFVGVCTSQMVSGSSMNYSTPHAGVNIRGKKVAIQSTPQETTIYMLEGESTVRSGNRDLGGQIIRPGEQAVIRPGLSGQPPSVTISPIPNELMASIDERVSVACNARKTVTFETIERRAEAGAGGPGEVEVAGAENPGNQADNATTGGSFDADGEIVARPAVPTTVPQNIVVSPDRLPGT